MNPTIEALMKRPCHLQLVRDEDAEGAVGWVASVAEHDGRIAFAMTVNAEAFCTKHEEQKKRKGWTTDTLLAKPPPSR